MKRNVFHSLEIISRVLKTLGVSGYKLLINIKVKFYPAVMVLVIMLLVPVIFGGTVITTDNSGLLSNNVTSIFVDSFNIKWFGTNMGISRFDETDWDTISTDNYLLSNSINQLTYERTSYGHELWIATNGGLSVAAFNIDGVTAATTYHKGNSLIVNDTVTAVGVDVLHNRWIGTNAGISLFGSSGWDSLFKYKDCNTYTPIFDLTDITITGFGNYTNTGQTYVATYGGGVLRYNYNEIDGFTGASTMGELWSGLFTNNINSIRIYDTIQYYGADNGVHIHHGGYTKENWINFSTLDGMVSNHVHAIEVDNNGAIWIGTDAGLNIKNGKKWYTYEMSDGLVNPVINDIRMDFDGTIWIATEGGIEYFDSIPGRQTGGFLPIQCMNVIAWDVTSTSSRITWTNGDEESRIAFIKAGNSELAEPVDFVTYIADTAFGQGDEVNGWYCIYKGTGSTVTVGGLSPQTMYRIMVCEFSGLPGEEKYVTFGAIGNPANFTTMNTDIEYNRFEDFAIFPNPFKSFLDIKNKFATGSYEVNIYSLDGKLKVQSIVSGNTARINTGNLSPGAYIVKINIGESSYSYKVVKH